MTLIQPGDRLIQRMDSDAVRALGYDLRDLVLQLEAEHSPLFRAVAVWWKQYEATPRTKEKNFPFVGAANVVVPLIGIVCDALASRALAQATAAEPTIWSCVSQDDSPERQRTARNMSRWINWQAAGNEFSLKHVLAEQFLELFVVGRGACAIQWRHDVRPVFFGRANGGFKTDNVVFHRGPLIEHVPTEHLLWDRTKRVGDAPVVARRHEWLWTELRDKAKLDDAWDREAVEEVKKWPGIDDGSPTAHISRVKASLDLRDADALEVQPHDVREVWVDWSVLGRRFEVEGQEEWGGTQVPLLAHIHMQSGRVLRLVGSPYALPYKPFVDFRFRSGRGVAKRLEMIQLIETTVVNQELDAGTRRNALWAVTNDASLQRRPIDPSKFFLVSSMDSLQPFPMPNYTQSNLALMVAMNTLAERWMGHSDPLLGRETRSGGHPAPATSTLALLEQLNVMSAGTDVVLREELSRMGECLAILNQQFETNEGGRLQRILGPEDAASVGAYLFPDEPIPGNYWFNVVALSRNENPDARMRQALMVAQAAQNYGALMAQGAMVLDNPQASPRTKAIWARLMDSMGGLFERFLDAANVDDTERFVVELQSLGVDAQGAFQQFLREASAASGAAGPAGAAAGGAPGAAGGAGVGPVPGGVGGPGAGAARGNGRAFTGGGVLG